MTEENRECEKKNKEEDQKSKKFKKREIEGYVDHYADKGKEY